MTSNPDILLSIRDLCVDFDTLDGVTHAVRGASLDLHRGQTLAVVGESGSGKSVTCYAILRLIQRPGRITSGSILLNLPDRPPIDIAKLTDKSEDLYKIRGGKISMIFQEPMTALSPVHTIGNQICEAILLHQPVGRRAAEKKAAAMLGRVGIANPEARLRQYPFEFSGGMRQRVVIAMALVCRPMILIADEPTTALDVTTQAQILQLIRELQEELQTSVIFITHDLGVVAQVAHQVVVMQRGRIMETASTRQLFSLPYHLYTRRLLASLPSLARQPERVSRILHEPLPETLPPQLSLHDAADRPGHIPVWHTFPSGRSILAWRKPEAAR